MEKPARLPGPALTAPVECMEALSAHAAGATPRRGLSGSRDIGEPITDTQYSLLAWCENKRLWAGEVEKICRDVSGGLFDHIEELDDAACGRALAIVVRRRRRLRQEDVDAEIWYRRQYCRFQGPAPDELSPPMERAPCLSAGVRS